jgi:hypothetical protein
MNEVEKIRERINQVELEVGFLRTLRMTRDPLKAVVAGELEIDRIKEIDAMKAQLAELEMAA